MQESKPRILVVHHSSAAGHPLVDVLDAAGFKGVAAYTGTAILATIYADPPQCVIMPFGLTSGSGSGPLVHQLKNDNVYGHLPVILLIAPGDLKSIDWAQVPADDYLVQPFSDEELVARTGLCLARAGRDVNANPLTGLPGNISILREAERRLGSGQAFAMAYVDLDFFKPFNDKYGFARGDEVLRMTARIIVNAISSLGSTDTYVGHVGGDDFIFLTPPHLMPRACEEITRNFDLIVPNFYDDEDRNQGSIHSVDRQGKACVFALMGISIAVIDTTISTIAHLADISARVADVKKIAKTVPGSNYIIDRRK